MKKILFTGLVIVLMSCKKDGGTQKECGTAICTEMFAMMNMYIADSNNSAIQLDSYYSVNNDTQDTFRTQQAPYIDGSYVILDDSYTSKMYNRKYNFSFIGIKSGKVVVKEPFIASADCCHINKVSGTDTVIVK